MIQIFRKPGWVLNPNDKIVNAILKRCELNGTSVRGVAVD